MIGPPECKVNTLSLPTKLGPLGLNLLVNLKVIFHWVNTLSSSTLLLRSFFLAFLKNLFNSSLILLRLVTGSVMTKRPLGSLFLVAFVRKSLLVVDVTCLPPKLLSKAYQQIKYKLRLLLDHGTVKGVYYEQRRKYSRVNGVTSPKILSKNETELVNHCSNYRRKKTTAWFQR